MPPLMSKQEKQEQIDAIVAKVQQLDEQDAKNAKATLEAAIEKGGLLTQAKGVLGHGKFMIWVKEQAKKKEFKFSHTTANKCMTLWEHRDDPKLKSCVNLSQAYSRFCSTTKDKNTVQVPLKMPKEHHDEWLLWTGKLPEYCPAYDPTKLGEFLLTLVKVKLQELGCDTDSATKTASAA